MAEDIFNFEDAGVKLPLEDVAPEYYTVTNPQTGKREAKLAQDLTAAQIKAFAAQEDKNYPTFGVSGGKVSVVGNQKYLDSDIVNSTIKTLQEYYKGSDLTNEQVAENFQKTLDEVNKQVKSQLQYQEYADFLDKTGFSDAAYRNYSLAVQESDPKTTTNLLKSKKKFYGLKKDGTLTDEPMTPDQWLTYWKENYNPEERAQLWMDGAEALARASKGGTDNDLYAALPYILMGHTETRNIPSAILNMVNPFNGMDVNEDLAQAGVVTPIYGFDDTNDLSVFTQAFIRQLGMRGLEIASDVATFDNPWSELGATTGGQYFGIPDWDDSDLEALTREEYQDLADTARAAVKAGFDTYEKMEKEYGAETAKKLWTVYSFSKTDPRAVGGGKVLDTIRNEKGEVVAEEGDYPGYKTYQDFQSRLAEWRKGRGGFETWSQSAIDDMNKYVSQMSVYSPNFATAGIVGGQIASFVAEQAALSLVTGGALSAPNVAARASKLFNVGAAKALEATKIGQKVASLSPSLAKAINAMAVSTSATALGANGYRLGKAALDGATRASKVLYTLGSIGNWAIREVGEDALRGLVDDVITKNSLDSQGNLDPNKLVENVYMNAVMLGLAKGAKFTLGGLGSVIDAAGAKNIDGVELNTTQRHQLNLFQKALDDQYSRVQFRGWDADGHPEITVNGKVKVLDQITPSGETAEAIQEVTGVAAPTAARTLENILADENVPEATKQKITEILEQKRVADEANGGAAENWKEEIKTKIQESLDDDEIRQAFPDGTIKIGDDTIKIDTKEFTSGDVNRVTGKEFASMDEAIEGLRNAKTTSNFASAINGILRQSIDFAKNFKNAVQEFADANNMTVRDVMVAIRESRLAGEETIPGLRELWETHWKPVQERLLDIQEAITGIRPASHDFYFRDMLEGTFNPSASGAWTINDTGILGLLGGDADFDLSASSTARNTGKLGELAADKLEYDPEVLAREFVASRMQTIWQSDDMGKIFATMQEAHDAGEFEFTEAQAAKSVGAVQRAAKEVENSDGVQSIQKLVNVDELSYDFGKEDMAKLDEDIKTQEAKVKDLEAQAKKADSVDTKKAASDALRDAESKRYSREEVHTPETERIKMDIAQKTGTDLDETPFKVLDDDNGEVIMMLDEKPGATSEGSLRDYNRDYKGRESKVILVDPDEYTRVLTSDPSSNTSADTAKNIEFDSKTNKYVQDMQNGDKFPVPYIKYNKNGFDGQEGRHRAMAAARAGYDKIPVAVSVPAGKTPKDIGFRNYDDITDDIAKIVTENNRVKNAEYEKTRADIEAKQKANEAEKTRINNELAAEKQKLADLEQRKAAAASVTIESGEKSLAKELDDAAEADKKSVLETQRSFNKSAKKSNAAELISRNSGYSRRGVRVNPSKKLVGVNYMPGNPLGKFGSLFNDNFIKGNSIKMEYSGYKADGTPTRMAITAYNGGYKMYAEAGSFARNVVIDVRNGMSLWDAIYKQVYDNGFFIEPSNNQRVKYGALTVSEQAAKVTDKFMDRMLADRRFAHVFSDDGTVKSTDGLVAILTTRFRGQGINDFTKFLRKADWDSFTRAEQSWLNARAYEMTASTNKSTFKKIIDGFIKGSMALRYRSNMGWNLKNGQLQLTECQRAFTANKIGDFGATLKRLATDSEFRAEVSDRTYILAADSVGAGFSKSDLDKVTDTYTQLASESVINKNGIITDIDKLKAKFKDFDDSLLGSVQGGEYAKNYILIAGFTAAGKRAGLSGAELDTYVRNRFNVEALAGTNVGKIGLTDSRIGQFTFMYLGFPIRELTLQAHLIKGGGTVGGKGFKKALGSLDYIAKMLGAKGAVWAMEAPWGYSLLDQIGIDPFGVLNQYDPIQTDWEEREPGWRWLDLGIQYNPFLQGAMTSVVSDIYMAYRAAEEEARADYMKEHNGSTEGFEWSMFEDGGDEFQDIMKGLTPVGEQVWGFVPGRTFYQRIEGELQDLNRGYHMSRTGNRMYEANTDPGNALWGMLTGRRNTTNAQDYYQTANPIRGAIEGGWAGLGQQMGRGFGSLNPFRGFREFDPADSETYTDWFDGSYNDQQNWNTGVYAFREEAQQIKDKYDRYITQGKELATQNSRENEFADLRGRLEKFVKAYTDKHPEGISYSKQNQLVNIFNLGDYQPTVDEAVREAEGDVDYTQWNAAQDRYAQGNFPTPYGLRQTKEGENVYGQSPQLEQVLSQQRYGIDSDVAPTISKMFKNQQFDTPLGRMTMKDYKDKVYAQISPEYDKDKPDYNKISQLQEEYLETLSKNVIQPILNTYGQSVLSAGKSSEIMQEFGRMLNGMIPSEEYRIDKKGRKIYQSTPYMSVDIKSWLNKNFKAYSNNVNTTNRATKDRIQSIRDSLDQGHTSTAMSKVRALIQDIGNGKASVSREELEWLQGVLND